MVRLFKTRRMWLVHSGITVICGVSYLDLFRRKAIEKRKTSEADLGALDEYEHVFAQWMFSAQHTQSHTRTPSAPSKENTDGNCKIDPELPWKDGTDN